jgi:predicted nucleic acid binding AN1-type Zn finger protein
MYTYTTNMEEQTLKKYKRCCHESCRDRLRLFRHRCGCKKDFCLTHKAPEDHGCGYREEDDKEEFVRRMQCIASKMIKV